VSTLTENPVKSSVAMTGEVNLHGQVLPIGGLKEKMLAALRAGIKTVIIPLENEKDLAEIPSNIKDNLEIKTVEWVEEVLLIALENPIAGLELPGSKIIEKSENKDTLTH
jgi:ATP-dependent Lon protease